MFCSSFLFFIGGGDGIQIQMQQNLNRMKREAAEREHMCDDLEAEIKMMQQQLAQKGAYMAESWH